MKYDKYIGIPYLINGRDSAGLDCWGLVRLYYSQELNIDLPAYSSLYNDPADQSIRTEISSQLDNWEPLEAPALNSVCLFNIYGEPAHVGIYIGNNKFLHARQGSDSVIESLDNPKWKSRFIGCFNYKASTGIALAGHPHPLRTKTVYDWTIAGTTVQDAYNFISSKYRISDRLAKRIIILVDGVEIPQAQWSNTILLPNQLVSYRAVPTGDNALRTILTIAVIVAAASIGDWADATATAAGWSSTAVTAARVVATAATMYAGTALINAVAPIRLPQQENPGSAKGLNLFSGTSNQANRFGAIPVVLGKMRMTGLLGATPYIQSLQETSLVNLLIIWGFGPLQVSDICVGATPISAYYGKQAGFEQDFPVPVTLEGWPEEDHSKFDNLYSRDIEQSYVNVLLVNNEEEGSPWKSVALNSEDITDLDVTFTFPEGMRQIRTKGEWAGAVDESVAEVEIQLRKYNTSTNTWEGWQERPLYSIGDYSATSPAVVVQDKLPSSYYSTSYTSEKLYLWVTYALNTSGEIRRFDGTVTEQKYSEPSAELIALLEKQRFATRPGSVRPTYTRLPHKPTGWLPLYSICVYGTRAVEIVNHLTNYQAYSGLSLTTTETIAHEYGDSWNYNDYVSATHVNITAGAVYTTGASLNPGTTLTEWTSRELVGTAGFYIVEDRAWGDLMREAAVWYDTEAQDVDYTFSRNFTKSGHYKIDAAIDDTGTIYIDGLPVLEVPANSFQSTTSTLYYIEAGTHSIRIKARNTGGPSGFAVKITYTTGGINSTETGGNTALAFGKPGFFYKQKDAFNFTYKIKDLTPGRYEVRVRRLNSDIVEPTDSLHNYNKVALLSITAYVKALDANGNPQGPLNPLPVGHLAKTALRLQSTNKANGNVDGINAIVHSIAYSWDRSLQKWIIRPTNNPADLFVYVLMHSANAYRMTLQDVDLQVDIPALQAWSEFCDDNGYAFNSVITQTQSILDILKDICAAGLASPTYVDGKWSVIVDKPRNYVTQHFTPHNSWGFESSKLIPRLPDAFRVQFSNEDRAYQPDEVLVFNYGKTASNAEIFEELSLPGVTSARQAKRLARWHFAQLKLRPEIYTLNVDFEHLVCTRGDVVQVSHDVPLWGVSSGRVRSVQGNIISLSEETYLEAAKQYQIQVRTNTGVGSGIHTETLNIVSPTTSGYYSTVQCLAAIPSTIEVDNLFTIGETQKVSQKLVLLSIEYQQNHSAKLTLTDYSPEIYNINLDDTNLELPAYNANITGYSNEIARLTIDSVPLIVAASSDSGQAVEISSGIYQNIAILSIGGQPGLPAVAQQLQVQVVPADSEFSLVSTAGIYTEDKSASSVTISGLRSGYAYKARARYRNSAGTITGPWSDAFYFSCLGKTENATVVPSIVLDLEGSYIVAKPSAQLSLPRDFSKYEYRLFKDSGTEDFWDLDLSANNILVSQSLAEGRFNLLDIPLPRLSEQGITYRVACRAVDTNNNYSSISALGTIVLTTIK